LNDGGKKKLGGPSQPKAAPAHHQPLAGKFKFQQRNMAMNPSGQGQVFSLALYLLSKPISTSQLDC
jgi:hypothetical protein